MTRHAENHPRGPATSVMDGAPPFRRLLVAIDSSSAAQGAFDLACQWVGQHGADVWFLQLTEEHRQRRGAFETDVDPVAVQPANHVVVNGPTRGARSRQLAHGIAEAAAAFHADVIVVGIDHERLTGHRLAPSLRDQITRATALPVLMAPATDPQRSGHRRPLSALEQEAAAPARRYAHV